ncbi:DUF397 domain-containing protein [Streptomyces sp. NBC_01431]|uniref:DUF397 domain-containing protein n=1 Tax=Streptomyces sp. NBC_01431 TaxID=2903863 RepID=UPI002E32EBD5|nr:DUF397 domain-containing protein [Streptomyces sp. NBC_01431]
MRISPKYDLSKATWHKSSYSGGDGGDCLEVARWHKSSYSGGDGGNCLEVARWRKSTHSGGDGGNCLEVADDCTEFVPVRDSKAVPDGPALVFRAAAWSAFVADIKGSNTAG